MDITDKDVSDYQKLYKSKFGKVIDKQAAWTKLSKLVRQMEIVYQPITQNQLEELATREAMKADAEALAQLIYDIYQDKKRQQSGKA
jgi:hypothetical protein